jgi:hypothetical protein
VVAPSLEDQLVDSIVEDGESITKRMASEEEPMAIYIQEDVTLTPSEFNKQRSHCFRMEEQPEVSRRPRSNQRLESAMSEEHQSPVLKETARVHRVIVENFGWSKLNQQSP